MSLFGVGLLAKAKRASNEALILLGKSNGELKKLGNSYHIINLVK